MNGARGVKGGGGGVMTTIKICGTKMIILLDTLRSCSGAARVRGAGAGLQRVCLVDPLV